MNIKTIKQHDLSDEEVLAIGYQDEMLVGYLSKESGDVICEAGDALLLNVRAYIPVKELVELFKAAESHPVEIGELGGFGGC